MLISLFQHNRRHVAAMLLLIMALETTLPVFASGRRSPQPSMNNRLNSTSQFNILRTKESEKPIGHKKKDDSKRYSRLVSPQAYSKLKQKFVAGPSQPEMSTFKSVGASNMVDPFTGDFSYNIPLLDVGGYPVNIHYNSNVTMDQEASWVGLGWNLNPGTVGRSMRGLPDDFNGVDQIVKTIHTTPNINLGLSSGFGLEGLGKPLGKLAPSGSLGITYDNYKGYGLELGLGLSPLRSTMPGGGLLTGTLSFTNSSTAGIGIVPSISYSSKLDQTRKSAENGDLSNSLSGNLNYNSRAGLMSMGMSASSGPGRFSNNAKNSTATFEVPASMSFSRPSFTPGTEVPFTSQNYSFNVKTGWSFGGIFTNISLNAYVSTQYIQDKDTVKSYPAYGYLHFSKAAGNPNALLDFNREHDGTYVDKVTPVLATPNYTYDVYNITAEGTGGSFRPYRSDVGYVYSASNKTSSSQLNLGIDLGPFHAGPNIKPVISGTTTSAWVSDNKLRKVIEFQQKDSTFEDVVFRNPMEMPIQSDQYLNRIGHDTLVRPVLEGNGANVVLANSLAALPNGITTAYTIPLPNVIVKNKREKRNQVISYLNAKEASNFGLDRRLTSYPLNYTPFTKCDDQEVLPLERIDMDPKGYRKAHHISEITVLNADGKRYVYGVPAYNITQQNLTFAVNNDGNISDYKNGLTSYNIPKELSTENTSGMDGYFSKEEIPGYAHSFLLSGILSSDYIDITGDGISDDDMGDAVKFGYTCLYGKDNSFGWRTPSEAGKASFNNGLKSYSRDDKASIIYGRKEIWYLHSLVSKNMVAVFRTSKTRPDAMSSSSVNGGYDSEAQLARLERIDLYSKADLVKNGTLAKAIKSVWFDYDFSLCKGVTGLTNGKLTLKRIYFTYNGSSKKSNAYTFNYQVNPNYHAKHSDTWGNYKNPDVNPGALENQDFPYVVQDKATADQYAAAWCLTDINLPSGGALKVTYESDDYGFVQNKRAMQLFAIVGLGRSESDGRPGMAQTGYLYGPKGEDYSYIFVDVDKPLYSRDDVTTKYLEGIKTLFFKLRVQMPTDRWGSGAEAIPMVCDVEDYGLVAGTSRRIWIKLKNVGGKNAIKHFAFQFIKENLPSKAYPGSETGSKPDLKGLVNMVASQGKNMSQLVLGFDNDAIRTGVCRRLYPDRSFVKLNSPNYAKLGGGLRVKRIEVYDNFKKMTGGAMADASYGQEYDYTTTLATIERGVSKRIIISSGVATYEPLHITVKVYHHFSAKFTTR